MISLSLGGGEAADPGKKRGTMHIGEMLEKAGVVTREQVESALEYQKSIGGHLGHIMTKLGYVSESKLLEFLSEQMQIPTFDLEGFTPPPECLNRLPPRLLLRHNAVPIRWEMGILTVGISDPTDFAAIDEIRLHAGGTVETVLVSPTQARDLLNRLFAAKDKEEEESASSSSATDRAHRGRYRLADLVKELRGESKEEPRSASPSFPTLADLPPDKLVVGLARALVFKGILTEQDILGAIAERLEEEKRR